jgi:hypothetical protein
MFQLSIILAIVTVLIWCITELRGSRRMRLSLGIMSLTLIGWAAFQGGQIIERVHWGVEIKHERVFIETAMDRIERSLDAGETTTVQQAVSAYNEVLRSSTNQTRYLEASTALIDRLK